MFGFASVCFWELMNPFISMVFGAERVMELPIVFLLVLNFYLLGMRNTIITFRDTMGIFREGGFIPLSCALINVVVSILLAPGMGVAGVALGTTISIAVTMLWLEPIVLFKHGFKKKPWKYFIKYAVYLVVTAIACIATKLLCDVLFGSDMRFGIFVLRMIICLILPNAIFFVIFFRTKEFRELKGMVLRTLGSKLGRKAAE